MVCICRTRRSILRGKKTLVAASRDDGLYAFSTDRGLIYRVDYASGRITPFSTQPVKLAGKDLAVALETRGSGLVLLGRQNVVAYGPDGSVKFERHHAAPKRHAVIQALLYAQAARGAMASFASGVYAAGFAAAAAETQDGSIERNVTTSLSSGYSEMGEGYAGLAGDYWAAARERFQASASARDAASAPPTSSPTNATKAPAINQRLRPSRSRAFSVRPAW